MASELNPIDLKNAPSLPELVDEVRKTRKSRIIRADGEDVAEIRPVPKRRSLRNAKPVTEDDPLFQVIGIGDSGKGDISENKHEYLLRAKRQTRQKTYTLEEVFGAAHDTGGPRDFDQMIREAKEERAEKLVKQLHG